MTTLLRTFFSGGNLFSVALTFLFPFVKTNEKMVAEVKMIVKSNEKVVAEADVLNEKVVAEVVNEKV